MTILNIETSGRICSVALTRDGALEMQLDDREGMQHANRLAPFVERCMAELHRKEEKLDAAKQLLLNSFHLSLQRFISI